MNLAYLAGSSRANLIVLSLPLVLTVVSTGGDQKRLYSGELKSYLQTTESRLS